jgi:Ca-activated chloride channel family protein
MLRLFLSLACGLAAAAAVAAQQTVFRGASDTVRLFVTVADRDGRIITTLTRDQFEVRDEGRTQPITVFDNSPQPIQLILMLDVSGSMAGSLPVLRAASEQLFLRLGPDDVARVGTFGREIAISPGFTRDLDALRAALPAEIPESAPTPLWRALDEAMAAFDASSDRRPVVLVLSDGKDSPPLSFRDRPVSQYDVIERARNDSVMIYAVGLPSRQIGMRPMVGPQGLGAALQAGMPDPILGRTALETGGGYSEIRRLDGLAEAFARIADELHSQYLIGFSPPARDGKVHDVEVRVSERGLKARARKSYTAPRS